MPTENIFFFFLAAWLIKCIKPQADVASARAGWDQVDLLVAVDQVPTPSHVVQAVSRVPGCSAGSATRTGAGSGSERAGDEQSRETALFWWRQLATSPQVYNFYPEPPLTSSADEHLQIWPWSLEIFLPLPGQVPTSCRVGRRDDVTVLQMQQSEKPSAFSLNP